MIIWKFFLAIIFTFFIGIGLLPLTSALGVWLGLFVFVFILSFFID